MSGALEARLFGNFEIRRDGGDLSSQLPGQKGRAVVAFLAVRYPGGATREELTDVAWPVSHPKDPRANLRTLLTRIRNVLGRDVFIENGGLAFAPGLLSTDLARIRNQVAEARMLQAAGRAHEAITQARAAIDALDAGFLRGIEGEWADRLRRSFEDDLSEMLGCVADLGSHIGGAMGDIAIAAARELVERDGYLERGHAHLIRALARRGERAAALAAFETIRMRLRHDLGTSPGPDLRDLHAALLRDDDLGAPSATIGGLSQAMDIPLPSAVRATKGEPFVGRKVELEIIERNVAGPSDGSRVLTVTGPAGIGKTRLVYEALSNLGGDHHLVLLGRSEAEAPLAYQPFQEAFGGLVDALPAGVTDSLIDGYPSLARVFHRFAAEGDVVGISEDERHLLFEATAAVLRRLTELVPVVFALDDLHAADRPTQQMFVHVARALSDRPITFIVAYRSTIADHAEGFGELVNDLIAHAHVTQLTVNPLREPDVTRLCDLSVPGGAHPELVEMVRDRSQGHPLFARELIRYAIERYGPGRDGRAPVAGAHREWLVPDSVQQVVLSRAARLDEQDRDVLVRMATLGGPVRPAEIAAAADVPTSDVLTALERALKMGLTAVSADDPLAFTFGHPLFKDSLLASLTPARRAHAQLENAQRLERLWIGDIDEHVTELAYQRLGAAEHGLDSSTAVEWAVLAAERADRHLAHEVAVSLYQRALALLTDAPAQQRATLQLSLAEAQWRAGLREESRATRRDAYLLASRLREPTLMAQAAIGFERYIEVDVFSDEDRHMIEESLALQPPPKQRAQLLSRLCLVDQSRGEAELVHATATEAVDLARKIGDDETLADTLNAQLFAMRSPGSPVDVRHGLAAELVDLGRRLGSNERRLEGEAHRLVAIADAGRSFEIRGAVERLGRIAQGTRQPYWVFYQYSWAGMLAFAEGDLERSARLDEIASTMAVGARADSAEGRAATEVQRAVEQGRAHEVVDLVAQWVDTRGPYGVWGAANAAVLAFAGATEEATSSLHALMDHKRIRLPHDLLWSLSICILADAVHVLGETELAPVVSAELAAMPRSIVSSGRCLLLVSHRLGQLAFACGDHETALAHLATARMQGQELAAGLLVAWADVETAAVLLDRGHPGDRVRGQQLLDAARSFANGRGLGLLEFRIAALLGQL